jgi:hypothetical protein
MIYLKWFFVLLWGCMLVLAGLVLWQPFAYSEDDAAYAEASQSLRKSMTFDEFKREVNAIISRTGAILGVGETFGGFFLDELILAWDTN